jgi:hypothetical protein
MVSRPPQENEATGSVRATRSSLKSTAPGRSLSSLLNQRPLKEASFRLEIAIPAAATQLVTGAGKEAAGMPMSVWTLVRTEARGLQ